MGDLERFSEDAVRTAIRVLDPMRRYHRMEFRGFDRIPKGPAVLVANHNGGTSPVDGLFLIHHYRTRGLTERVYVLAHDMVFRPRRLARVLQSIGIVRASPEQARRVLRAGHKILTFPGGDRETLRLFSKRKQVSLSGRSGFARLAIDNDVPIVPVVSAGAHESFVVLNEGRRVAKLLQLDQRFRVHVMPTIFALPWGIVWGLGAGLPYLPLPARITVEAGQPLRPSSYPSGGDRAGAPASAIALRTQQIMQRMLDGLYAERRFPVFG